jgi:hypothetical protein
VPPNTHGRGTVLKLSEIIHLEYFAIMSRLGKMGFASNATALDRSRSLVGLAAARECLRSQSVNVGPVVEPAAMGKINVEDVPVAVSMRPESKSPAIAVAALGSVW